jgi:tetratricopeptide (TPR) repeat protein
MTKTTSKKIFQKVFIVLSGMAFLVFSIAGVLKMVTSESSNRNQAQQALSPAEQLQQQAEGYELVLAREPDNPFVLQNLLAIYLQLGNLEGGLPLAEKLVALEPENIRYQETLAAIKQGLAQSAENQVATEESKEIVKTEEEK